MLGVRCQVSGVRCQVSSTQCYMSCVASHMSHLTCNRSLTPTATAMDPPHANSPTMHIKMVGKDAKVTFFSPVDSFKPFLSKSYKF